MYHIDTLSQSDKQLLMRYIKRIGELYGSYASNQRDREELRFSQENGVVTSGDATLAGLQLDTYPDRPHSVRTPWGSWHLALSGVRGVDFRGFLSHLTLREYRDASYSDSQYSVPIGHDRKVYDIVAIDGEALPEPAAQTTRSRSADGRREIADWDRFYRGD